MCVGGLVFGALPLGVPNTTLGHDSQHSNGQLSQKKSGRYSLVVIIVSMPHFSQTKTTRCDMVAGIAVLNFSTISAAHFRQLSG
jgi:hypothetical protein